MKYIFYLDNKDVHYIYTKNKCKTIDIFVRNLLNYPTFENKRKNDTFLEENC